MKNLRLLALVAFFGVSGTAYSDDTAELNKKLNNPVANLITVPIEYNRDSNIGPEETGEVDSIKFTPVVPIDINEDWNLITRTIFSYVDQDIPEYGLDETGISDIALSLYFSPKELGESGIIWGAGPVLLFDSATEDSLGAGKWGAGPSGVVLKQMGPWTVGGLAHYLTDFAGDGDRADIEQIFLQPFLSYNLNAKTSFTVQSEITRDMEEDETGAFVLVQANRMFNVGNQIMQGRIGVRHWYERMGYGPDSTELNLRLTLLFPQ
jgi:hypothetical protein